MSSTSGNRGQWYARQSQVAETLLESLDELLSNSSLLVESLKVVSLLCASIATNRGDIDHAVSELNKGSALDGDIQIGDVVQAEVDELLVLVLANPLDEAVGLQRRAKLEGRQSILGEAEVEELGDAHAGGLAELLLLLSEVGAADVASRALGAEGLKESENLGGGGLLEAKFVLDSEAVRWGRGRRRWSTD